MTKKLSPILADAVIVIDAHNNGCWELLRNSYQVAIPATILEEELFHFGSVNNKQGMNPSKWIKEGKVLRLEAESIDFQFLSSKLSDDFIKSLDPGELEALALINSKKYKDYLFTTADRAAIKALGVLGLGERGISLEALLEGAGAANKTLKELPKKLTKNWFNGCVKEGFLEKHLWIKNKS